MKLADYNNPLLTTPLEFIEEPEKDIEGLKELSKQMYQLVAQFGGAGLSANQIGINKRMFVVKYGDSKKGEGKPKCLSKSRAASLRAKGGKKAIGAAVSKKRRNDPNKNRRGKAKNVSNTKGK